MVNGRAITQERVVWEIGMPLHFDVGTQPVAGYLLVRPLGRGGFGEVWEALAPGGVRVALKFIRLGTTEAGSEQRALEVIRDIRHPHLLDVQFAVRVEDCLIIAMPLCDENLMDRLRACQDQGLIGLSRHELLGYMADLARAVDYLNEPRHPWGDDGRPIGVQHRDIKPHNIFLVGDSVKLADFGLAKIAVSSDSVHMAGTADYMSPEAIRCRVSQWSDQYSLAVTYVQLRTGKLPFEGNSVVHFIYAHLEQAPDLSGLPDEERPVLARALAKTPEERWSNCRAFVRALVTASRTEAGQRKGATSLGASACAVNHEGPRTVNSSIPPEARTANPLFSIRVDDIDTSPTAERAEGGGLRRRHARRFGPAGLFAILAVFVAMLVITRLGPSTDRTPGEIPPAAGTNPPFNPKALKPSGAVASRLGKSGMPELPNPRPTPPVEPPKLITNTLGMKLTLIPAGEFLMGSPDSDKDAGDDEKPQHQVRITRPFYLGTTEVTQGQYRAVTGESPSFFKGSDDLPVEVSWNDAIAFCNKLSEKEGLRAYSQFGTDSQSGGEGYRLPTEAEWEYACRAGSTTRYSFGEEAASLGEYACYDGNSDGKSHAVGEKRANAWGLFDMHGNVWEWCWDGYDAKFYGQSPDADPLGASQAAPRVLRGGSWSFNPRCARSAYRLWLSPGHRSNDQGFRVARVRSGR